MKLTADLVAASPSYINAIKEYELDLSNNHITQLENLGSTRNLYDALNLCTNTVRVLGNFPSLPRLLSIYASDNRIASIDRTLASSIPNIRTLVLTGNDLRELSDLEPLREFTQLEHLSVVGNPVASVQWARLWCVWRFKALKVLDFERVTERERKEAQKVFETNGELSALALDILAVQQTNTFVPGEGLEEEETVDLDKQQSIAELKARIRSEMAQIEAMDEYI
ncbi:U2 snRNP complex subunit [Coemansia sp. RSA 1972]|nr:U2 snRNP complex subunit [Coemansia sp. RSA 1972]